MDTCFAILKFGGLGHTCVIHAKDDARIREFGARMPANRVLVNTPAPQGSTGITTDVWPSMTLGCGAAAGNSTSDNVGPQHLINIKRLAYTVRTVAEAFPEPPPAAASTAVSSGLGPIDRQTVVAAVEKYLAARGFSVSGSSPAPAASQAAPSVVTSEIPGIAAEVVDRFLARRADRPVPAPKPGLG
jgi:hypothetical protein